MPEEERLTLDVTVTDNFSEELGFLGSQLNRLDRKIRNTGGGDDEIKIDVTVDALDEVTKVETLNQELERLDDADANVDVDDDNDVFNNLNPLEEQAAANVIGPTQFQERERKFGVDADGGAGAVADGDGDGDSRLFTLENVDDFEEPLGKFFDREALASRGGEATRIEDVLNRDLDTLVDFERVSRLAVDPESDIDADIGNRLRGAEGVSEAVEAIAELNDVDPKLTRLGGESRSQRFVREFDEMRFTMERFHQLFAAFIPLMTVFIGALPAAITAIGALAVAAVGAAGVLGGIAGLGALGLSLQDGDGLSMDPLMDELKEVGQSFKEAFAPLAEAMVPTLQIFLDELEMMAGPLARASSGLLQFRGLFQDFGTWLQQTIPSFTRDFLAFTDAVMPVLQGLLGTLADIDLFGGLANQLALALPSLKLFGSALLDIIPAVVTISQGFLAMASAITWVISLFARVVNQSELLTVALGALAGGYLTLVTAATLYNFVTTGSIALATKWAATLLGGVVSAISSAVVAIAGLVSSMLAYNSVALTALTITTLLVGVLGAGALAVVGLTTAFSALKDMIGGARGELAAFSNESLSDRGPTMSQSGGMGADSNVYQDNSTTVINADDRDSAIRQQEARGFERQQDIDSIFGSGA